MKKLSFGDALGELILKKRKVLGLTQMQLAEDALGASSKTRRISELENGKVANPHPKTIDPIISTLGITEAELEECFNKAGTAPDGDLDAAYKEAETLIVELAKQYDFENDDASLEEIDEFLRSKASEFMQLKIAIEAMNATDDAIAKFQLRAIDALKVGDFDDVDELLLKAEEKLLNDKTIVQIREQSNIRILRADSRFLEGNLEEAYSHYLKAALVFEQFDHNLMMEVFDQLAGKIYETQRRSIKPSYWIARKLLKTALSKMNPSDEVSSIGDAHFRLSLICRNEASSSEVDTEIELLKKAATHARAALKVFVGQGERYKIHATQASLGNCLSQLTYVTGDTSHAESAIDVLENAKINIPDDEDSQTLMGHVCNSLGATILRFHGAQQDEVSDEITDRVIGIYQDAVNASELSFDLEVFGTANINLARLLREKSKSDAIDERASTFLRVRSISCFQTAIETYPETIFPHAFAEAHLGLAESLYLHATFSEKNTMEVYFFRAMEAFWKAGEILSEEHDAGRWAYIQCRIGGIFGSHAKFFGGSSARGDIEQAISYFNKGLRVYTAIGSEIHIKSCFNNLNLLKRELEKLNSSED